MADNSNLKTLKDLFEYGYNNDYSTVKCSLVSRVSDLVMFDKLVYENYRDILMKNSIVRRLSDAEIIKYAYKPDRFAMDIYGNPALSHLVLYMNNCGEYEFNLSTVRFVSPNAIENVLKLIISKESKNIKGSKKKYMG